MNQINKYIMLAVVSVSLLSVYYHNVKNAVITGSQYDYKIISFVFPQKGLRDYNHAQKYWWKGRVVTCMMAGAWCKLNGVTLDAKYKSTKDAIDKFSNAVASWGAIWLMTTFIVIILLSKTPFLFIVGLSAGLQYAWLPLSEGQYNPWDAPQVFIWTFILLVPTTRHRKNILWLIPLCAVLKEDIIFCSILVLFFDDVPIKERVKWFIVVGLSCVVIKFVLSKIGGAEAGIWNQSFHYEHICRTGEYWIIERNIHLLTQWHNFNPIWFAAAGFPIVLFLLPGKEALQYKLIAGAYLICAFVPLNFSEGRLFSCLIPVFFVAMERVKYGLENNLSLQR